MTDPYIPDWFRTAKPGDEVVYLGGLFTSADKPAPIVEGRVYIILDLELRNYPLYGTVACIYVKRGHRAWASHFRPVQYDPLFLSTLTKETTHV